MTARSARPLSEEQLRVLQRVAQLRVTTAPQLHALIDFLRPHTLRATYHRLQVLVREGYLRTDLVQPGRGRFSPYFYGLASRGARVLQRTAERSLLLTRPAQHVLEYLLFRNEVYAQARRDGWLVASPVLASAPALARYLQVFNTWAVESKERELAELQARGFGPLDVAHVRRDAEQLPAFLPKALSFEFLVRLDRAGRATDVVLLVIDDPRRSVARQGRSTNLPSVGSERTLVDRRTKQPFVVPGLRLVLRDTLSVFDAGRGALARASPRLRAWRRALREKYGEAGGEQLLATETLFPDLWARRIEAVPALPAVT